MVLVITAFMSLSIGMIVGAFVADKAWEEAIEELKEARR